MIIQHNMAASGTNRMLNENEKTKLKSLEKLSSGYKINRAADNAAGLAISEKMRSQIHGLNRLSETCRRELTLYRRRTARSRKYRA